MSETDIAAILNAITSMRAEVMSKLDSLCDRVNSLERDRVTRNAIYTVEKKYEKEKLDWGKWIVRSISAAAAFALSIFAWKLLTGAVKIVEIVQ